MTAHQEPTPVSPAIALLEQLRASSGLAQTQGLDDATVSQFAATDARLQEAIEAAVAARRALPGHLAAMVEGPEGAACVAVQEGWLNFYGPTATNPYIPLAARGPWLVTAHGAVLHDNGGYGMLGFGHAPQSVLDAMARPQAMANIMTPSLSHRRFVDALRSEVGHTRGSCPFTHILALNSGSESVTVASRISDIHAWSMVGPGGRHEGRTVKFLAVTGAFHGRTDRPAQLSHSSSRTYNRVLASFQGRNNLVVVPQNDLEALEAAFAAADAEGVYFESMFIEPVMGEGRPGRAVSREFYDAARRLTREHGAFLVVDSIQAGIRTTGCLSIVDYPGFEDADAPDMETWSKALNGGQYPLSVLGLGEDAAKSYVRGAYGNTMTGNPRALDVACAVLERLTPELRANVREQGKRFTDGLRALQAEFPEVVVDVSGTGLLFAAELHPEHFPVMGHANSDAPGVELRCRLRGIGVIHGGKNALRFTPNFDISTAEVELVLRELRVLFAELQAELTEAC